MTFRHILTATLIELITELINHAHRQIATIATAIEAIAARPTAPPDAIGSEIMAEDGYSPEC